MTSQGGPEADLATQIRVELVRRGMLQQDLADRMGIGRDTLNRYLMGHRSMTMATFIKAANVLGVAPSSLLAPVTLPGSGDS